MEIKMTMQINSLVDQERAPLLRRRHKISSGIDTPRSTAEHYEDAYVGSHATRSSCWPWRGLFDALLAPRVPEGQVLAQNLLKKALKESSLPAPSRNSLPLWRHFIEHCSSESIPLVRLITESRPQGRCGLQHLLEVEDYDAVLLIRPHLPHGLYANGTISVGDMIAQVRQGEYHGKGVEVCPNGNWYRGDAGNGKNSKGYGYSELNGYIWEGQFLDGFACGYGTMRCPDGQVHKGYFEVERGPDGRAIRLLPPRPNETLPGVYPGT
jgi:hypothetical protein